MFQKMLQVGSGGGSTEPKIVFNHKDIKHSSGSAVPYTVSGNIKALVAIRQDGTTDNIYWDETLGYMNSATTKFANVSGNSYQFSTANYGSRYYIVEIYEEQ